MIALNAQLNPVKMLIFFTVGVLAGAIVAGCGSSSNDTVTLNGYSFNNDSATLTNIYFPARAGDVYHFVGYESLADSSYVWTYTPGEEIAGVRTLREEGRVTRTDGSSYLEFSSALAQDTAGNVHVLKNYNDSIETLCGVAADTDPTLIMPANPTLGTSFGPAASYEGTVLSLSETVGTYTNVLHSRFINNISATGQDQYDDYWAPGVGQVKSEWSLADGTSGYWLRTE